MLSRGVNDGLTISEVIGWCCMIGRRLTVQLWPWPGCIVLSCRMSSKLILGSRMFFERGGICPPFCTRAVNFARTVFDFLGTVKCGGGD